MPTNSSSSSSLWQLSTVKILPYKQDQLQMSALLQLHSYHSVYQKHDLVKQDEIKIRYLKNSGRLLTYLLVSESSHLFSCSGCRTFDPRLPLPSISYNIPQPRPSTVPALYLVHQASLSQTPHKLTLCPWKQRCLPSYFHS